MSTVTLNFSGFVHFQHPSKKFFYRLSQIYITFLCHELLLRILVGNLLEVWTWCISTVVVCYWLSPESSWRLGGLGGIFLPINGLPYCTWYLLVSIMSRGSVLYCGVVYFSGLNCGFWKSGNTSRTCKSNTPIVKKLSQLFYYDLRRKNDFNVHNTVCPIQSLGLGSKSVRLDTVLFKLLNQC